MVVQFIPGQGLNANAYIVRGSVLVDAGVTPMALEAHRDAITHIVLTHCHFDHIAFLPVLQKMTGAKICIHKADVEGLIQDILSLSLQFGAHAPGIIPDIILEDEDYIEGLRVIHTPGHTQGSICVYDPDSFDLISGDTVFSDGAFGRYDFPGGSKSDLLHSLQRLAEFRVSGLYPGHGIPIPENGERFIKGALTLIQSGYG